MSHNFFLFPHMELRLMFHTLWTNSSCHGYRSLEFPVSWVIKLPTLILLYWFISVTPYFLGLRSLGEQSRTFHRLLVSSPGFCILHTSFGENWGCFFPRCIKQQEIHRSDAQHPSGYVNPGVCSEYPGFLEPLLLETLQPHWAACSNAFIALALECFFLPCCVRPPPLVLSAGDTEDNFICSPLQEPNADNTQSEQSTCLLGFTWRISGGIWWGFRVFISGPTIAKGLHFSDWIWGPLQHC